MNGEVAIICSSADPASLNIADHLLGLCTWQEGIGGDYRAFGDCRLIITNEDQTAYRGLDKRIEGLGLRPGLIIFACRHKSKQEVPWLGGHFTGILGDEPQIAAAAPGGLKSFLCHLSSCAPEGYSISAEATHHGPTDITTPSFFAEIGSGEMYWSDQQAGRAVARAILGSAICRQDAPVFLGFGGGHYMQRQTSLILETGIAFGHMFSNYQVDALDLDLIEEARDKSGASYAYLDRKSLRSETRNRISDMLDDLGIPIIREKEIRERFPATGAMQKENGRGSGPGRE